MTGCRGTNFFNTMLGELYDRLVKSLVEELFSVNYYQNSKLLLLQGDDGVQVFSRPEYGYLWLWAAEKLGFQLTDSKQLESTRALEFLRVFYFAGNGYTSGACRFANLINKSPEGSQFMMVESEVRRVHDSCYKMVRSGMNVDMCHAWWFFLIHRALVNHERMVDPGVPVKHIGLECVLGWLKLSPPGRCLRVIRQMGPSPPRASLEMVDVTDLPNHASKDLSDYIRQQAAPYTRHQAGEDSWTELIRRLTVSSYMPLMTHYVRRVV